MHLGKLKNLVFLTVSNNKLYSLTGIEDLNNLEGVHMFDCSLNSISELQSLDRLDNVGLDNNLDITDMEILLNIDSLKTVYVGNQTRNKYNDVFAALKEKGCYVGPVD